MISSHVSSAQGVYPRALEINTIPVANAAPAAGGANLLRNSGTSLLKPLNDRPISSTPQFWNGAAPPQRMSAERMAITISALESALLRLALSGTSHAVTQRHARQVGVASLRTGSIVSSKPAPHAVDMDSAIEKKAAFVTRVAPNELHALLILLLQVQNSLARTQAEITQIALRQIMAATHARANSIRLDAAVAFGVAIGAAALSIGLNVAGATKSIQGLRSKNTINAKFAEVDKRYHAAKHEAVKNRNDTPDDITRKERSLTSAASERAKVVCEREQGFVEADEMQIKGNAMTQGARIASELIGAFAHLHSGLQRVQQTYAETNKTMAEIWRGQAQTEMEQRRQATTEVLNLVKSLNALEQRGWSDVRIA